MKKKIYSILALAVSAMMLPLASCSDDEQLASAGEASPNGELVHMVATADTESDVLSRTMRPETLEDGLAFRWAEGDKLLVTGATGIPLGVLTLDEGVGESQGTFSGDVYIEGDGQQINVFYLGSAANVETVTGNTFTDNFSTQEGSLESLPQYDFMAAKTTVSLVDGQASVNFNIESQLGFAHYKLNGGEGVSFDGVEVTISGTNLHNVATFNLANGEKTMNQGNIKATAHGNDLYVIIGPAENVELSFSATVDGKEYAGTLPARTYNANRYFAAGLGEGQEVVMSKDEEPIVLDGSIFGITWAPVNLRSWFDCDGTDGYLYSYIPTVPFAEQGITLNTNETVFSDTDNPYVYHYQWDRDFGFIASTEAYDVANVRLPNYSAIPYNWYLTYYDQKMQQCTKANSYQNFEVFYSPGTGIYDWCSTSGRKEWAHTSDQDGGIASPKGYRIPTYSEWQTLLPDGENKTYSYPAGGYEVAEGTAYPFKAQIQSDGSTVIWSVMISSVNKYLDVRRVVGKYAVEDITREILLQCESPLHLPADGYRMGDGLQQRQERGLYWASDASDTTSGRAYCFSFTINTSARTIALACGLQYRKFGFSVRMIKEK